MIHDAIDTRYAYAQLGLDFGAPFDQIRNVLAHATAYRFLTRTRIDTVERFVEFFTARIVFGTPEFSFTEIRSAYFDQVKELHPDTHAEDKGAEERLKVLNSAYEVISKIHKEARAYYERDAEERHEEEKIARQVTEKEAEAIAGRTHKNARTGYKPDPSWASYTAKTRQTEEPAYTHPTAGPVRYMAFSVPRYIRLSRLFYLSHHSIIGSRAVRTNGGRLLVYDVVMLPEMDFKRAKMNLGIEGHGSPELTMSRLVPAYIPIDTKTLLVPTGEQSPYHFAKAYFREEFRIDAAEGKGQPASA